MTLNEKIKKYPEEVALCFILVIGAVLRFHHLGFTSFSNDELSAVTRAGYNSFGEMITNGVMIDFHPAGVEAFMYYWIKIFGDGVFIIRFPFALAGILSIFVLYLLATKWFNKITGLFSAAALAMLQFPLLYSQLARPYSPGLLFVLCAAYFWTRILFPEPQEQSNKKANKWNYAGFVIAMSACTHTHYFAFMLAGIIGLSGFFFLKKENLKGYVASGLIIILLFIPEIPVFTHQMSIGGLSEWLGKPDQTFFRSFINYCFNDSNLLFYLFFGILVATFTYFRRSIVLTKFHWLCLVWFILPFFIGYYYSIARNPVLQYSTLIFGFPFLLMFIFSFMPVLNTKLVYQALAVFILICSYNTVKANHYYWTNHFGVFKEIAADAVSWSDKYDSEKMLKVISVSNPEYIDYYFKKMNRKMKIDLYKVYEESDIAKLMALVDTSSADYFLYGWTNTSHPEEVAQVIMNKFPTVIERDTFFNSSVTLFKRDPVAAAFRRIPSSTDFENNLWGDETGLRSDELAHSGKYSQKIDDKTEYSIGYSKPLIYFTSVPRGMVTASAWFNAKEISNDAKLVLSFESGGKPFEYYSADIKSFNLEPGKWQQVLLSRPIPKMKSIDDIIKVYVWNPGKKIFFVDDLEVKVSNPLQ